MNVQLNGDTRTLAHGTTVALLIAQLGLAGKRIAVEINEDIVPRSRHDSTVLKDGDCIEIVHAIGGG